MSRPKKQITEKNAYTVGKYFLKMLEKYDTDILKDDDRKFEANRQLEYIAWKNEYYKKNEMARVKSMNGWMRYHITETGIKRMWAAMRQKDFHRESGKRQITVDSMAHFQLKTYAQEKNLNFSEAIIQLCKMAETEF